MTELQHQCDTLASTSNSSLLRQVSPTNLLGFSCNGLLTEWTARAPLLLCMLSAVAGKSDRPAALSLAGALLLHQRCKHLVLYQDILGLILDFGGATDTTISALAQCGVACSLSTLHRLKKQIEIYHYEYVIGPLLPRSQAESGIRVLP